MMDWTIHPDGGMWMGKRDLAHVLFSTIRRDIFTGLWRGYIARQSKPGIFFDSLDFGEVITEMEATINLMEAA